MKYITTLLLLILVPITANASLLSGELPSSLKEALRDASATNNEYVKEAVIKYSKDTYPAYKNKIDSYVASIKDEEAKREKEAALAKNSAKPKSKFSGDVDANVNLVQGNTKQQDLHLATKLNYESGKWANTLKMLTRSSQEDSVQTQEEYQVNNQTKYSLDSRNYSFVELEYVNDRFEGYQYRNSELLGLGHKFYNNDVFVLAGEVGVGARQSLLTDETEENTLLGKVAAKASWKITDAITLDQDINSSLGSDVVITIWDTAVKTKITESVYLKLNYNFQHINNVPADEKNIDSTTVLGVGYEF